MPSIANGESGASVRAKLNTLLANANIATYTTRAALVSAWSDGLLDDGALVSDGTVMYKASAGATAIGDLPGLVPAGQISLRHFTSAAANGTTSITAALQAAIDYAGGGTDPLTFSEPGDSRSVYIPTGLWLWNDHDADGVINTINDPITVWSDGPLTGVLVTNNVDDVGFLVQAASGVTTGSTVSNVNFTGLTLWNTTVPTNPNTGSAPLFTAANAGIVYDRAMGQVNNCAIYNFGGGIDCLAVPEGVRILNSDINTTSTGSAVGAVAGTAHIRIKVRQVDAASTGTKYQWTVDSGGDGSYYAYSNSIFIDNLNLRAGAIAAIDQQEATILVEGVDGLYVTNSHIAWGTLACVLIQPRHPPGTGSFGTPLTNVQFSNCLIDPLPGKSSHGVLARDFYSIGSTPASDFIFSNCLVAGCTAEGVWIDLDVSGFQWRGGAFKGVGTAGGAGIRLSGGASGCFIKDVSFRNVGDSNADPCVWVENASRVGIEGLNGDGNTYGLVTVEIGCNDVVIGPCVSGAIIDDEPAFKIPAGTFQAYVSGVSQTNASGTIASASVITLPLGLDSFYVTGTTTINTISGQTMFNGRTFTIVFDDACTLTEVGNIDLGGANLVTRPGAAYKFTYNADPSINKIILDGGGALVGVFNTPITGTAVTQSATDTTAGRLLKVGDYGAGAAAGTYLFGRANILGTVSQSGGVPTGAVIERGNNANGEYVRFADGTQICWFFITSSASATVTWTFPSAFADANVRVTGAIRTDASAFMSFSTATSTSVGCAVYNAAGARAAYSTSIMAVGRWF